jgi:hypothetical protein
VHQPLPPPPPGVSALSGTRGLETKRGGGDSKSSRITNIVVNPKYRSNPSMFWLIKQLKFHRQVVRLYANLRAILATTKSYKLIRTDYEAIFRAFLLSKFFNTCISEPEFFWGSIPRDLILTYVSCLYLAENYGTQLRDHSLFMTGGGLAKKGGG